MSINPESFTSDPLSNKQITNREGDGVSRSTAPQNIVAGNPAPYYEVSVKDKPSTGSDQTITHTGPGVGIAGGVGDPSDMQGFVSATGNKILIDNNFGSDTITLQHHSGATIMIDADGSIHMISSGKKGVGLIAPKGDATVFARNHLILKADGRITIETDGDLDFNVGGNLGLHVRGDMITSVRGSSEESIEGSKVFEVAKDMSTMIAGDNRITSAGKTKIQSSQSIDMDAGLDIFVRSDAAISMQAQKEFTALSLTDMNLGTKTKFTALATGDMNLGSKAKVIAKSSGDMSIESGGTFDVKAASTTKISSGGDASIHSASTVDVLGSGKIQIKGSATDVQVGGSPSLSAPSDPADPGEASLAQYAPAETIIDNITTQRTAPDFPKNSKKMSKEEFSLYKNEGGTPNQIAEGAASGNSGAGIVPEIVDTGMSAESASEGDYDRPAGAVTGTGTAEKNPTPMPSSIYNSSEKISRHVTVGMILDLRDCPASQHKAVLTEAMNIAWNILDPLFEKFGSRMKITSWYRTSKSTSKHTTGGAVDLRCSNKDDTSFTAQIAAYVRDNLPYSRIYLEKNDSPGIHVHLESAQPGQPGGGLVITCADPGCKNSQPGLQLSYAQAALRGRVGTYG